MAILIIPFLVFVRMQLKRGIDDDAVGLVDRARYENSLCSSLCLCVSVVHPILAEPSAYENNAIREANMAATAINPRQPVRAILATAYGAIPRMRVLSWPEITIR